MAVGTPQTSTGASTATPSVAVPTGVAAGDIVILLLSADAVSGTLGWPSGFTGLTDTGLTLDGQHVGAAWKRLTGADTGSYTASIAGSGAYAMAAIPLTGRHATNPPVIGTVTANNSTNAGTSLTETATGVTAVAGDDILHVAMEDVAAASIGNGHSAWSLGTGIVDVIDGGVGWCNIGAAKAENVAAGATGSETVTFSKSPSGNNGYATFLIRVPAAAGSTTQVSTTRRVVYNVQANVAATRRVNYGVRAQVAATRRLSYGVLAQVSATRRLAYAVLATAVGTRRLVYGVAGPTTQVSATRRVNYLVIAQVAGTRRVSYGVQAGVVSTRRVTYNVVSNVAATRRLTYSVTANVAGTRRVSYVVAGTATGAVAFLPLTGVGR